MRSKSISCCCSLACTDSSGFRTGTTTNSTSSRASRPVRTNPPVNPVAPSNNTFIRFSLFCEYSINPSGSVARIADPSGHESRKHDPVHKATAKQHSIFSDWAERQPAVRTGWPITAAQKHQNTPCSRLPHRKYPGQTRLYSGTPQEFDAWAKARQPQVQARLPEFYEQSFGHSIETGFLRFAALWCWRP